MRNLILPFIAVAVLAAGCSKQAEVIDPNTDQQTIVQNQSYPYKLTPEGAAAQAELLMTKSGVQSRSKAVAEVKVIRRSDVYRDAPMVAYGLGGQNDTLMYAVNFSDNQGFMLLSSDMRVPTLATAEEGSFDVNTNNPTVQVFLKMSELYAQRQVNAHEKMLDSIFGRKDAAPYIVTRDETFLGYDYGMSNGGGLIEFKLPLIKTRWHQDAPYNTLYGTKYNPTVSESLIAPAGCMVTALAQILAYHGYPADTKFHGKNKNNYPYTVYDYWGMTNKPDGPDAATPGHISILYKEIKDLIGTWVVTKHTQSNGWITAHSSTEAYPKDIIKLADWGFKAEGFKEPEADYSWIQPYDANGAIYSIKYQRPVFITGGGLYPDGSDYSHGWILDGYNKYAEVTSSVWERWQNNKTGVITTRNYHTIVLQKAATHLHCNWGWGDVSGKGLNGFYNEGVWDLRKPVNTDNGQTPNPSVPGVYEYIMVCLSLRPI